MLRETGTPVAEGWGTEMPMLALLTLLLAAFASSPVDSAQVPGAPPPASPEEPSGGDAYAPRSLPSDAVPGPDDIGDPGASSATVAEADPSVSVDRLPSYVANQAERKGLEVHPHERVQETVGDKKVEVGTWARVGYRADQEQGVLSHGPYLGMARLQVRASDTHRVSGFVQLGADQGQIGLLDAKMRARLGERFILAVGRMKAPVSHDFLIPAPQMLQPHRALLVGLAPRRTNGVQLRYRAEGETAVLTTRVGVFDPLAPGAAVLAGPLLVAQVGAHTHSGFFVHGAVAAWLHPKELHADAAALGAPWDRHADLALGWSDQAWTFHVEGLIAAPLARPELDWGATMLAARRVSVSSVALVLEPVVSADVQRTEGRILRATAALNVHHDGWHLFETLAWEATSLPSGHVGHRVLFQVQAGL